MNFEQIKRLADTILYEGYILYPYRATALKNQQRFNFGILAPPAGHDASSMRTECLIEGNDPVIHLCIRCLHLLSREVYRRATNSGEESTAEYEPTASLQIDGEVHQTWQEAIERGVSAESLQVADLASETHQINFGFESSHEEKMVLDENSHSVGRILRRQEAVQGIVRVRAESLRQGLWKVCVEIRNATTLPTQPTVGFESLSTSASYDDSPYSRRNEELLRSLVSTHTILGVRGGQFVSLLNPDESNVESAAKCDNVGTWPVFAGEIGQKDLLLSSPIILYDYPQIASESDGDFYDGLEIDEMLVLRVMTMTDDEKREMRNVDGRARQILERTEALTPVELQKLHGIIRQMAPAKTP